MKTTILAFLSFLLILCVQGQSDMTEGCKCSDWFKGRVHRKLIRAGPVIHEPSVFCPRTEITIVTTANKEKCVDPESLFGQLILRNSQKKTAVSRSTVTASTQTITQSSPSLQTTTKL